MTIPVGVTIEQAARELLAAEYDKAGHVAPQIDLRSGNQSDWFRAKHVIAAISTAIRSRSDLRDLALEEAAKLVSDQAYAAFSNRLVGEDLATAIRALKATPITTAGDLE